jgi:transcription antitermination factor NusA-like protein
LNISDDSEYIEVKRIAHVIKSNFVKVAVASSNGFNPVKFCHEKIEGKIKRYTDLKMIFVQHETDMIQYIKNSLYLCPQISIREVIYRRDAQKANVKVAEKRRALCIGKGEINIPR